MAAPLRLTSLRLADDAQRRDIIDDEAFGERIRSGDPAAFETLVRTYADPLAAFALGRVGSRAEASEIVQDVFIKVWERRAEWRVQAGSVGRYLYAAVRNQALNRLRHRRISHHRTVTLGAEIAGISMAEDALGRSADGAMAAHDLANAVTRAMATLPPRCRETFELRAQHGMSRAETAEVLGISLKAVEANTTRALKLLRAALADYL